VTEWDGFRELDFDAIFKDMHKPAFVFDGRLTLDTPKLRDIGFKVHVTGKTVLEGRE
jgi:UDPglucose 6-dehydrogenase